MSTVLLIKTRYFVMSRMMHNYSSSLERRMLADQKVWGSVLRLGRPFFSVYLIRIYTNFYTEHESKNSKDARDMGLT